MKTETLFGFLFLLTMFIILKKDFILEKYGNYFLSNNTNLIDIFSKIKIKHKKGEVFMLTENKKKSVISNPMILTTLLFLVISFIFSVCYLFELLYINKHDDAIFHLERLINLSEQLKQGAWKPIANPFALDGYGYPTDLFYGNFYLYPFAWLIAKGSTPISSLALLSILIQFTTLWIAYFSAPRLIKCFGLEFEIRKMQQLSIYFALFMTLFFPRVYNMVNRFAIGELVGAIFLPIVMIGIFSFINEKPKTLNKWLIAGFSLTLTTHLISFLVNCIIFLMVLFFAYKKWFFQKEKWLELIRSIGFAILLTSFFLFPLLEQLLSNEFLYQVYQPHGPISEYAFNILSTDSILVPCFIQIGLLFIGRLLFKHTALLPKTDRLIIRSFSVFCYSLILVTDLFPWELFDQCFPITMIQFPFRLLNWSSFFLALGGVIFFQTNSTFFNFDFTSDKLKIKLLLIGGLFSLVTCLSMNNHYLSRLKHLINMEEEVISGQVIESDSDSKQFIPEYTQYEIGRGEYLPSRLDVELLKTKDNHLMINHHKIRNITYRLNGITQEWQFNSTIEKIQTIQIPIIHYKGYEVQLNHQTIPYSQSPNGLIQVDFVQPIVLTEGETLTVSYIGTTVQTVSFWISIGTLETTIILTIKKRKD